MTTILSQLGEIIDRLETLRAESAEIHATIKNNGHECDTCSAFGNGYEAAMYEATLIARTEEERLRAKLAESEAERLLYELGFPDERKQVALLEALVYKLYEDDGSTENLTYDERNILNAIMREEPPDPRGPGT